MDLFQRARIGKTLLIYVLWGLSVAGVVFLSLRPGADFPLSFWNADKLGHFLAYLWLALLPALVIQSLIRMILLSLLLVSLGMLLECLQIHVPGRSFSLADMIANTIGVLLGIAAGKLCRFGLARQRSIETIVIRP